MDPAAKVLEDKIAHWFQYHAPTPEQLPLLQEIRDAGKNLADVIARNTPICADQSAAIRHVREATMTANAAMMCGGK